MKLVMDEKLKHRLIGLAVIISLGAIFAPAAMKKSSQHLENNFSVNVKLPPKPIAPDVVMTDEKELFKTIKVAKVTIPQVSGDRQLTELVKAEPVKSDSINTNRTQETAKVEQDVKSKATQVTLNKAASITAKKTMKVAAVQTMKRPTTIALKQKVVKKPVKVRVAAKAQSTPIISKNVYAVQVASFSQLTNAQVLVNRLHSKGYKANFIKVPSRQGSVYKVYAGHSPRKLDVMKLKSQLASAMQINGFVVNTGVS